jgi:L-lactate dehydrogenase complex protein LldE
MANAGYERYSTGCTEGFIRSFAKYDYIVSPSGSCVLHLKEHLQEEKMPDTVGYLRNHLYELCEFLTDVLRIQSLPGRFPYRVGLHQSCHGQRGLRLSQSSEIVGRDFSKPRQLLQMVEGIELVTLDRKDECCGFGGTFCVTEDAVSVKMGQGRVADHVRNGAQFITAGDMSCLMHLEGILRRQQSPVQVVHIAQILNAS